MYFPGKSAGTVMLGVMMTIVAGTGVPAMAEPTSPSNRRQAEAPDKFVAQSLTVLPAAGLVLATSLSANPWPLAAVPASFGMGHLYAGEPGKAALITVGGPVVTALGYGVGLGIGYGLARLITPSDFNPNNFEAPLGSIVLMAGGACLGLGAGLLGTWAWTFNDVGRIADERRREHLGPIRVPEATP